MRTIILQAVQAVLLGIVLASCASAPATPVAPTAAKLTYQSVPDGAELFEDGKSLGHVPLVRTYPANGAAEITTPDVKAVWPSGAETTYFTVLHPGDNRVATLQRPADVPGLADDLAHAQAVAAKRKSTGTGQSEAHDSANLCRQQPDQNGHGAAPDCL